MKDTLEAALGYVRRGWSLVPIPRGRKGPITKGWPDIRINDEAAVRAHFNGKPQNIGVNFGLTPGIIDADLDTVPAILAGRVLLPPTSCTFGHGQYRDAHRFYAPTQELNYFKFQSTGLRELDEETSPSTVVYCELRTGHGLQTILPPSRHPNGEVYEFSASGDPSPCDAVALWQGMCLVAITASLARLWPAPSTGEAKSLGHDAALALGGFCAHNGIDRDEARKMVEVLSRGVGERGDKIKNRVNAVTDAFECFKANRPTVGMPRLIELLSEEAAVIADFARMLAMTPGEDGPVPEYLRRDATLEVPTESTSPPQADAREPGDEPRDASGWSEPLPLVEQLPAVENFDLALLPSTLRPLVADVSELMQTPPDYAAAASFVALAGAVNRRAAVQPKEFDTSWREVPNLWGGLVGPPGVMKSPALHGAVKPLVEIEKSWQGGYEEQLKRFWIEKFRNEAEWNAYNDALRKMHRDAYSRGTSNAEPQQPLVRLTEKDAPKRKRLVVTDATFEALHEVLAANPAGLTVVRDELVGWIASLERRGREGERQFALEAWKGYGSFTIDRVSRGTVFLPAVCFSMVGNIQPARLRAYLTDAVEKPAEDDGLFQRFQVMVWPDVSRLWRNIDRVPSSTATGEALRTFERLVALDVEHPALLRFDPGAQRVFDAWRETLENRLRGELQSTPFLAQHLAKYRGLMPSIAALVEIAEAENLEGVELFISEKHALDAAAWCKYLESHARRVYSCAGSSAFHAACELARHIQAGDITSPFTAKDVYDQSWRGLDAPVTANAALAILQTFHWTRKTPKTTGAQGGRPTEKWIVNPKVKRV